MDARKLIAILLIVGGALALVYGGFSFTKATHKAELGPLKVEVSERQQVNIPLWAGIAAVVAGGLMLAGVGRR